MSTGTTTTVGVAACRSSTDAPTDDLYPNPDWPLLHEALASAGVNAVQAAWDDPDVDWDGFDAVVLRSTWDSVDRPAEFLAWIDRVDKGSNLINPATAVRWNLHKAYLADLASLGVPVVPTQWLAPGDDWEPEVTGEFIVKPAISAGGRETARYAPEETVLAQTHVRRLLDVGQTVMIQDYLPSVDEEGESKLIFLGGAFSHAVTMSPLLTPARGVVERPWEIDTRPHLVRVTPDQLAVAEATLERIETRLGLRPTYARIDLVRGPSDDHLVLETELIEPLLFLPLAPEAAPRLGRAIVDAITVDKRPEVDSCH
jgi:glutathione synthase/RimK-type ligase-like ATP-grasp enzyme